MPTAMLKNEIEKAGVRNAFSSLSVDDFLNVVEKAGADDSIVNGSFYRFIESLLHPYTFPATWQKLVNLGWSDEEIAGLVESKLVTESPTTLVAAIGLGALATQEYDEYSSYPNQEVDILYFTKAAQMVLGWLNTHVTMPKIGKDAFAE